MTGLPDLFTKYHPSYKIQSLNDSVNHWLVLLLSFHPLCCIFLSRPNTAVGYGYKITLCTVH